MQFLKKRNLLQNDTIYSLVKVIARNCVKKSRFTQKIRLFWKGLVT